jgi:hypothetical protein
MFNGHAESEKKINMLYDDVTKHYHVISNLTAALSRKYVCKGCNRGCARGVTHKCLETCSDCMSVPPCAYAYVRIPREACSRQFRSRACFDKHKTNKLEGKSVCEKKRSCVVCDKLTGPSGCTWV